MLRRPATIFALWHNDWEHGAVCVAGPEVAGVFPVELIRSEGGQPPEPLLADVRRELGSLSGADSLALVLLYQREGDEKVERAARRWLRRVQIHHSLRHREV